MQLPLFRPASVAYLANDGHGKSRLITPPGSFLVTAILATLVGCGLFLLTAQPFARKAIVHGYLHSSVMRLSPERSGTLIRLFIEAGERVNVGMPIAELKTHVKHQGNDAATYDSLLLGITAQIETTKQLQLQRVSQLLVKQRQLENSALHLRRIRIIQESRIERLVNNLKVAMPLFKRHLISRIEWGQFQDDLLLARQAMEEFRNRQEIIAEKQAQLVIENQNLAATHSLELLKVEEKKIQLARARANWLASMNQVIHSPVDGRVEAIFKQPGEVVAMKESILSLLPVSEPIGARLLIPGHAIGFIQSGQTVHIKYDAFPHLQFGTYTGRLTSISNHPILPQDLPLEIPADGTYFLGIVELADQNVSAFGISNPLKPGMTLKADIILNSRTLLEWLFEPLFAARHNHA